MLDGNNCIDINECITMSSPCSWGNGVSGVCQNTNGSYSCSYSKESQTNESFAYTLVDNATPLVKGNFIALIAKLNKEYLITFNTFLNKFDGWRSVICFSLDFDKCQSSLLNITVDPDGSLVFIKSSDDHFIKFKHPIKLKVWSNIEISLLPTNKTHQYKFTIKVNKIIVFSKVILNKQEYDNIQVYASDSFYESQDGCIEKFYFINGKSYSHMYQVIPPFKGENLQNIWIPDNDQINFWKSSYFTQILNGSIENNKLNHLGVLMFSNSEISVTIYPIWLERPYYNLNFKLSVIAYALQPSSLTINFNNSGESFHSTNLSLISNSLTAVEVVLTFDQYNEVLGFAISFERSHQYGMYLISVNCLMEDVDECNDSSQCPWSNSQCENTFGNFLCKCKNGWMMGEDNKSCIDINECNEISKCLWNNSECINTVGSYTCKCKNGWLIKDSSSCIEMLSSVSIITAAIVVPVVVVLTILVVIVAFWVWRKRFKSPSMMLNPDLYPLDNYTDQCEILSTDKWEIFPASIVFDKKIGQGAFGNVFTAKINSKFLAKTCYASLTGENDIREDYAVSVAVKLLKDGAIQSEINDFAEEINLMKGIGYHKNIVNMIACSTVRKPLCLVVELMENGDLLHFLRSRRTKLIASKVNDSSSSIMFTRNYQKSLEKTSLMRQINLVENEAITPNDLINFAWQVASGMEYLSSIKLVHRDLAARNILVGSEKNLKISDFGLTRKVNNELNYMSCNNRRLPVKWMSIEAIFDQVFTTYSDVWAFGVVLFEIVTLGGTPYPTTSNRELLALLKTGYRMDRPDNCSQTIFHHMLRCWNEDPLQRPSFTEFRELFGEILSQGGHYFSLEINEESNYYNAASFHSISSDTSDDDLEKELLLKPVQVKLCDEFVE